MNVLISGGCKNGKSYYAQCQAQQQAIKSGKRLYYIATMIPRDEEDWDRIRRHLSEREGWGFETIEQGMNLLEVLDDQRVDLSGVFLLDSVTAIMENEMFVRRDGGIDYDGMATDRIRRDLVTFAKATGSTVFVSDGIYGDKGEYSQSTEDYRKALAAADRALAGVCDRVVEISCGFAQEWKHPEEKKTE